MAKGTSKSVLLGIGDILDSEKLSPEEKINGIKKYLPVLSDLSDEEREGLVMNSIQNLGKGIAEEKAQMISMLLSDLLITLSVIQDLSNQLRFIDKYKDLEPVNVSNELSQIVQLQACVNQIKRLLTGYWDDLSGIHEKNNNT